IAFRLNTYCTHVFRRWLVEKALAKEKRQAYVMLIHKANGYC
ncbi:RhuM protein, partial [Bacteroides xylanisolvens]